MSEYAELEEEEHGLEQVAGCIHIGLRCVEIDQHKRPTIQMVLDMLNALPSTN